MAGRAADDKNGAMPGDAPDQVDPVLAVADRDNPLHRLLGGWRGGLESAAPSVVFASVYVLARQTLTVALVAAIGVAGVGISARLSADDGLTQTARVSGPVVKASKSVVMTSTDQAVIR